MIIVQTFGGPHAQLTSSDKDALNTAILGSKFCDMREAPVAIPEFQAPFVSFFVIDNRLYLASSPAEDAKVYINCKRVALKVLCGERPNIYYTTNAFNRLKRFPILVSLLLRTGILSS